MRIDTSAITSHFPNPQDGFTTTTSGSVSSGASTVGLNSIGDYSNGDVVALIIEPADADKKQVFVGIIDISGVQVTNVIWVGGINQSHASGATVVDYYDAAHVKMITKGLLVSHSQDGKLAATGGSLTSPKITNGLNDTNNNELLKFTATPSAVNELTLANAATGNSPTLTASGDDTNIGLKGVPKGTGVFSGFMAAKVGVILGASVLNTTGNKAITGLGFTPKLVRFTLIPTGSSSTSTYGVGAMTASSQFFAAGTSANPAAASRTSSTAACIGWLSAGNSTPVLLASYVSMDSDGFTINVGTASSTFDVAYEAIG